jgi:PAS domain-containing protein
MEFFTLGHIESVGILVVENNRISFVNSYLCKIFKAKKEEIQGTEFSLFCANHIKSLGADIDIILKTGKVVENLYIPNDRLLSLHVKICPKNDVDLSCIFSIEGTRLSYNTLIKSRGKSATSVRLIT